MAVSDLGVLVDTGNNIYEWVRESLGVVEDALVRERVEDLCEAVADAYNLIKITGASIPLPRVITRPLRSLCEKRKRMFWRKWKKRRVLGGRKDHPAVREVIRRLGEIEADDFGEAAFREGELFSHKAQMKLALVHANIDQGICFKKLVFPPVNGRSRLTIPLTTSVSYSNKGSRALIYMDEREEEDDGIMFEAMGHDQGHEELRNKQNLSLLCSMLLGASEVCIDVTKGGAAVEVSCKVRPEKHLVRVVIRQRGKQKQKKAFKYLGLFSVEALVLDPRMRFRLRHHRV